jgi:tetratricopeptide (TPR) repeat protein
MNSGLYSNALPLIQRQLTLTPDSTNALMTMGVVCLQLKEYEKAIPPLNKLLSLDTNNHAAVLNRAIACLQTDRLDQAQRDYETLAKVYTNAFQVYFGLGEIAYRKKDRPAAIRYYELYLSKDPPAAEALRVSERIKELNAAGSP